jgi:hypothetical protein
MNVKEEEDKPSLSLYECCPNLKWVDLFATPCGTYIQRSIITLLYTYEDPFKKPIEKTDLRIVYEQALT